jgi:hypothetical protein
MADPDDSNQTTPLKENNGAPLKTAGIQPEEEYEADLDSVIEADDSSTGTGAVDYDPSRQTQIRNEQNREMHEEEIR